MGGRVSEDIFGCAKAVLRTALHDAGARADMQWFGVAGGRGEAGRLEKFPVWKALDDQIGNRRFWVVVGDEEVGEKRFGYLQIFAA